MKQATGWCPGYRGTTTLEDYVSKFGKLRSKKVSNWTDELKAQVVEDYQNAEPTPETSMEIVSDIAENIGQTPNGVRMILTKAGVYVKKTPASGSKSSGGGGTRVSKEGAQQELSSALTDAGLEVDSSIITKLTGKAAKYFADAINKLNS
jgi:DNA-directed RNA polymerase subunit F|tara:strand:+ start:233 stop:682 length:450 start_codon:yes stop_codon:yes gene_type:complete